MKVAIEFYGHLRTFKKTVIDIQKYLIHQFKIQPDIFIHTWDHTDHSDVAWHNESGQKRGTSVTQADIDFLRNNYNPKAILVEPQIIPTDDKQYMMLMTENLTPFSVINNIFYTKWKSNELRKEYQEENNISYDFVVQARLDLYFRVPLQIERYFNYRTLIKKNPIEINLSNKLFYASDRWIESCHNDDIIYAGGSDILYFGTPHVIDQAVSVYKNISQYELDKIYYSNEYLMLYNAMQYGLEPVRIKFEKDIDFGILRTNQCANYLKEKKENSKRKGVKKIIKNIISIVKK